MNKSLTPVKHLVIAGGGTAGWMAAAAAAKLLGKQVKITLVESDEIGTVGVGEATIPPIRTFHKLLGVNEQAFLKATHGTFKLGIQFENWGKVNDKYIHSFGITGKECWAGEFHHFWLKGLEQGIDSNFGDYCFEFKAAQAERFGISQSNPINFAYHFDAGLYAKFLRNFSEPLGVKREEGKISKVNQCEESGFITSLELENGKEIVADFFIDCTGFRGLLIEQSLHTGYEDWSHYLPCDSAVALQTKTVEHVKPYTRSIAHESGWQWQIPLQSRVGNGLVYCSRYMQDDDAIKLLQEHVQGEHITTPKVIKFKPGRRLKGWNKNCLALGLASGFIEPLESTSIHLIMSGVIRFLRLFPFGGVSQHLEDEYNTKLKAELENIRDFIILHYNVTERTDSQFWRHCQRMEIPSTLRHKISLFEETGRVFLDDGDIFRVDSWTQVMLGQGIMPKQFHQIANIMNKRELEEFLTKLKAVVNSRVEHLPTHEEFIKQYCAME